MQTELEEAIRREVPEVEMVFAKIGTPEVATDPMQPSVADNFLIMAPRNEWPDPSLTKAELVAKIEGVTRDVPGNKY